MFSGVTVLRSWLRRGFDMTSLPVSTRGFRALIERDVTRVLDLIGAIWYEVCFHTRGFLLL